MRWPADVAVAGAPVVCLSAAAVVPLIALPPGVRAGIGGLLAAIAIGNLVFLTSRFRAVDGNLNDFLVALSPIDRDTTFVPVLFEGGPRGMFVAAFAHAVDYVAIEKDLVDFDDYEAATGYFPIRFKPNAQAADVYTIEAEPVKLDLPFLARRAQYIFTWYLEPAFERRPAGGTTS
jgi:hypothetical protein